MGFRTPLTSPALDTRDQPGAAGVVIDGSSARWHDGYGTTGRVILDSPPGGGTGFSGFSVVGSDGLGTIPARLDLREEELPGGDGYRSVAVLRADVIRLRGVTEGAAGPAWSTLPMGSAAWVPFDSTANLPRARQTAAGTVQLEGIVKLASGASFAAGGTSHVATLPAGWEPRTSIQRSIILLRDNATYFSASWLFIASGSRNLIVVNTSGSTLTAGWAWSLGSSWSIAPV